MGPFFDEEDEQEKSIFTNPLRQEEPELEDIPEGYELDLEPIEEIVEETPVPDDLQLEDIPEDYELDLEPLEEESVVEAPIATIDDEARELGLEDIPEGYELELDETEAEAPVDVRPFLPPLEEGQTGLDAEAIMTNPDRMKIVRDYLTIRNGDSFHQEEISDEEAYDAFINRMRAMGSNEVSLARDVWTLSHATDEEKVAMGKAYAMFEQMDSLWTSDGVFGAIDGVYDYAAGVLTSPSTWAGVGIGKAVVQAGSTATKQAVIKGTIEAARRAAIDASIKNGATRAVANEAGQAAVRQTAGVAAKALAYKTAIAATAIDGAAATVQDYVYQNQLINSGATDDYNKLQTFLAGSTALVAGGLAGYLDYRGVSHALSGTKGLVEESNKAAKQAATRNLNVSLAQNLKTYAKTDLDKWKGNVASGEKLNLDSRGLNQFLFDSLFGKQVGQTVTPGLVEDSMKKAGYVLPDENKAQHMIDVIRQLPQPEFQAVDNVFQQQVGLQLGDVLDGLSEFVSKGGGNQAQINLTAQRIGTMSTARKLAANLSAKYKLDEGNAAFAVKSTQYMQSLWRRFIVAHPATTAVNVKGWTGAYAATNFARIIHGGVLGSAGMAAKLASPVSATAKKFSDDALAESDALISSQVFSLKTLLNPGATRETYDALLEQMPEKYRSQLVNQSFSGISKDQAGPFGLDPNSKFVQAAESTANKASQISLMALQDTMTKSQSFVTAMDRQLRLDTGKGLTETLQTTGTYNVSDEVWNRATDSALKDIFSKDYTKGGQVLNKMADAAENLSSAPIIGFMFPFARFMNNALAFSMRFSPLHLTRAMSLVGDSQRLSRQALSTGSVEEAEALGRASKQARFDAGTAFSEAAVGSAFIGYMMTREQEKQKEGLKWFEERDPEGVVRDITTEFPTSLYNISGRILLQAANGQTIGEDLWKDLAEALGAPGGVASLSGDLEGVGKFVINSVDALRKGDQEGGGWQFFYGEVLKAAGGIASGFTRPVEPINALLGVYNDTTQTPDRRRLEGGDRLISEFTRYVDNIFYFMAGEAGFDAQNPKETMPRYSITDDGPVENADVLSGLLGNKAAASHTVVDRLLGQANMQAWRLIPRSNIPEYDAAILERVFNVLAPKAEGLINSPAWKQANQGQRQKMVRGLMTSTKETIVEWIESAPGSTEALDRRRYQWSMKDKQIAEDARTATGITNKPTELTSFELDALERAYDILKGRYDNLE